jgi:hypothetical protein
MRSSSNFKCSLWMRAGPQISQFGISVAKSSGGDDRVVKWYERADRGSTLIAANLQSSADVTDPFVHSGKSHPAGKPVCGADLFQEISPNASSCVRNGSFKDTILHANSHRSDFASRMPMHIRQGFLHEAIKGNLLVLAEFLNLQIVGDFYINPQAASLLEFLDEHSQGCPQAQFVQHGRMQEIGKCANLARHSFCQSQRFPDLRTRLCRQGVFRGF